MTADEKIYVLYHIIIMYLEGDMNKEQLITELKNFENA